ncbi:MAG TPA: response regulator transcription factor [Cyclobacteriaceae bacterium]|jgi:DNA-binding LytR/AlgR family response regulator|nr:response regulator transcription factor [Cyclobacteriaceae bacterium]
MIKCIIIDDEPLARRILKEYISKIPTLVLEGDYASPLKASEAILKNPVDVMFLDIQMAEISGIDFLKSLTSRPYVIITTAHAQYALDGFELDVVDYLLKPFNFTRFLKAVNKLSNLLEKTNSPPVQTPSQESFLFIKDGTKLVKIDLASLLFVEGLGDYVKLVSKGKTITSLQTLKKLETQLPNYFIRIHNSYIISLKALDAIQHNNVQIGDHLLPIGITYKKTFFDTIQKEGLGL